ncbi:hypothetical protein MATL_G00108440 [Megalops atlanticus]|uniref:Uncharacterized protein n=1 Tax=Megalops atlanticus TaxID=7932 RepID=A0A9D3PZD8_MEGAT|nr:hypothetical protein MATL_G00108440 [Megalops atlanticus]
MRPSLLLSPPPLFLSLALRTPAVPDELRRTAAARAAPWTVPFPRAGAGSHGSLSAAPSLGRTCSLGTENKRV